MWNFPRMCSPRALIVPRNRHEMNELGTVHKLRSYFFENFTRSVTLHLHSATHTMSILLISLICAELKRNNIATIIDPYNTQWKMFTGSSPNWGVQMSVLRGSVALWGCSRQANWMLSQTTFFQKMRSLRFNKTQGLGLWFEDVEDSRPVALPFFRRWYIFWGWKIGDTSRISKQTNKKPKVTVRNDLATHWKKLTAHKFVTTPI
jgi:hypothetical protein